MVQLAPALRPLPQVVVILKAPALAPVSAMLLMLRAALPGLERVTIWAGLVAPTARLAKVRPAGFSETAALFTATVKLTEFDAPPPGAGLVTTTGRVPAVASSLVLKVIFNCVELTKVGVWAAPL